MRQAVSPDFPLTHYFSELDRHFADFISRVAKTHDPDLWLAAALVSHFTQEGHVCLDLASVAGKSIGEEEGDRLLCPELQPWVHVLRQSNVVGASGDFRPLVLDASNRLYLYRYWEYESDLAKFLTERASRDLVPVDSETLKASLDRLFPQAASGEINGQQVAAMIAVLRSLCVISGGPGTGKTSTVVKILALLIEQVGGKKLAIALAAPTGKAAARLKDAAKRSKLDLVCAPEVLAQIPEEASTLHRLLGTLPGSIQFRHNRDNLLPYDVIVVDEASMIDLPLMAKLVQAIPQQSRLILLGDRDQLASVEPGSVFGDICSLAGVNRFSPGLGSQIQALVGLTWDLPLNESQAVLGDSIVVLKKSYRFGEASGIGRLSHAIRAGEREQADQLLKDESGSEISWKAIRSPQELRRSLETWVLEAYPVYLKAETPAEAFSLFDTSRILCALRKGPYGVRVVNKLVEEILTRTGLIRSRGRWYPGQPIIITRNDYSLRLFNGDIGLILEDRREGQASLRAFFPTGNGEFRTFLPAKLPEHETVYAMTVHKAQGSEFERVLFLLPDRGSEVLTRELIYTGITRARRQVELWGTRDIFSESIAKSIERKSGLQDALTG